MTADTAKSIEARQLITELGGLANAADLARRWGLSRQALSEKVQDVTFPSPAGSVGGRPVYFAAECDRWRELTVAQRKRPIDIRQGGSVEWRPIANPNQGG